MTIYVLSTRVNRLKELEPNGEETVQTKYGPVVGLVYPTFRRWQGMFCVCFFWIQEMEIELKK